MRLDWFVPFLRKKKKNESLGPPPLVVRLAQSVLPKSFFANRETGKPGVIRRMLKWIGPTMLSSPLRRVIQAICFAAFLWLFFYVCWPYTAEPLPPGAVSENWQLAEVDQETGDFRFTNGSEAEWVSEAGNLHIVDGGAAEYEDSYVGAFELKEAQNGQIVLIAPVEIDADKFDLLLTRAGPWSFYERSPNAWPQHYTDDLAAKEAVPADTFLVIDPLLSLSTAIAARSWVWSLTCAGVILVVCVVIPRGFCGYLCPLGTLIDLFDWAVSNRVKRFQVSDDGWWVHLKYYILMATLVAAFCGVLISGFVAAIPVITRGFLFLFEPLQTGTLRGWHQVPAMNAGHVFSIVLFVVVLGLGLLKPRFWCKYVCPSGAVFSLGNLFRVTERKVESTCINCNKCVEICPFDAIKPDFTTRVTDCTLCQTCGGVCPTHAIKFVERWNTVELKIENDPPTNETPIGRRGFMSLAAGTAAAVVGGIGITAATRALGSDGKSLPVRPPGSVPEKEFLDMCIRCGECFKVCPNNVLQAAGFEHGLESLWTPKVVADWAGCESSCNACGQVCPTGAIRALPIVEKKVARMGLAIVNQHTCLPLAGREECDLCVVECDKAGYHAIEQRREGTEVDDDGNPISDTGFIVPVVLPEKCVGCGLCQTRCYGINVEAKGLLKESAIIIEAGENYEDRTMSGSYQQLRRQEEAQREAAREKIEKPKPIEQPVPPTDVPEDDPFGTQDDSPF
jgi:ferredoxin